MHRQGKSGTQNVEWNRASSSVAGRHLHMRYNLVESNKYIKHPVGAIGLKMGRYGADFKIESLP